MVKEIKQFFVYVTNLEAMMKRKMNKFKVCILTSLMCSTIMNMRCDDDAIVLIADTRVLTISIIDNQDYLIDLKNQLEISYGSSPEISVNHDYTKLRFTVYNKLREAQRLLPQGLRFCIYEGYRSLATQKMLFDNHYHKVCELHPEWDASHCFDETTRLVSPVINKDGSTNIPPHSTGGAFDIYLIDDNGIAVDMGIHPQDGLGDVSGELCKANSDKISKEAQEYRKIMSNVLETVGFVNYPTEYWHWSYGDRYWAYHKKCDCALYGAI